MKNHNVKNLITITLYLQLRYFCLPCEPTNRIQKRCRWGMRLTSYRNKAYALFLYFSSWLRGMSTSNMYLSLIGSTWIRTRVHANYVGSDSVCTPEKFWIRSKKERSCTDPLSCAQGLRISTNRNPRLSIAHLKMLSFPKLSGSWKMAFSISITFQNPYGP